MVLPLEDRVKHSVLFSAADRQMEEFVDQESFEEGLLYSILFHPYILVPDIFFFISKRLSTHIGSEGRSLFEEALRAGIIIPSFRRPGTSSFHKALEIVKGQGILGLLDDDINRRLAFRLDGLTEQDSFQFTYWPSGRMLSETYESRLVRILTADMPPAFESIVEDRVRQKMERLWVVSEPWRRDTLQEAIRLSPEGLRRGSLMSAIGRSVGISGPIDDIRDIFPAALAQGRSLEELEAIRGVCRIMCDCYLHNLASEHQNDMSYPRYDPWAQLVLESLRSDPSNSARGEPWPAVEHTVHLPSTQLLLNMDPARIIGLRNDLYPDYRSAVIDWQRSPNSTNENRLRERLDAYASKIVSECQREYDFKRIALSVIGATAGTAGTLGAGLAFQPEQLAVSILNLAGAATTFLALGDLGYVLYRWASGKKTDEAHIRLRANPHLSIPAES